MERDLAFELMRYSHCMRFYDANFHDVSQHFAKFDRDGAESLR